MPKKYTGPSKPVPVAKTRERRVVKKKVLVGVNNRGQKKPVPNIKLLHKTYTQ